MSQATSNKKATCVGFYEMYIGQPTIDLKALWNTCKGNEDLFIKDFCRYYVHEAVHVEIAHIINDLYSFKEEEIVAKMSGTQWNETIRRSYK